MNYEFQSGLFNDSKSAHYAVAMSWLSAGGANDLAFVREYLGDNSDAEIADEMIDGWNMSVVDWFDRDAILAAIAQCRREYTEAQ